MMTICRDNRLEIEKEYLALLLNKNDLFNVIQVKPSWLYAIENKRLLQYCVECFEKWGVVKPDKILEKHKDFDVGYFAHILMDVMWFENSWKEQLKLSEESIVKFYKEDLIKLMNEKLKNNQMRYDEFMAKMKELDNIEINENITTLTKKEIVDNINVDNSKILFKDYAKLNNYLQLVQGDFLIIGATTGAGKSGFMLNLMNQLMLNYQCIYFNMEMSKSTIYKRLVSINASIPIKDILQPQSDYQAKKIENSMNILEKANLIVEHKANDIKQIRSAVAKLKDKNRHTILFIDHLGLTKVDGMKSLYEQATEVAKQLRQMCLEYDCTIISASQLNRGAYSSEEITLSMLKDSGELENSASKVILMYRDKESKNEDEIVEMNINIAKNRDGVCGVVKMMYDKTKQVFEEKRF